MKESKNVKLVVRIIGTVSILAGIYAIMTSAEFNVYFSPILFGVTLLGASFLGNITSQDGSTSS